ncbi:hypothetical protein F5Y17DRAFT_453446 [Xylariaceae sp. FL0594]|nr:hypothetical protein F5Y17DRAFT_453446 [Xylariaceae sp. FL0594]
MLKSVTPKKGVKEVCGTYVDVPDMSTSGGKSGIIVTVVVGPQKRSFQVHLSKLGPLDKLFETDDGTKFQVELPDEDREVFNLLVNWTYNGNLPQVAGNLQPSETLAGSILFEDDAESYLTPPSSKRLRNQCRSSSKATSRDTSIVSSKRKREEVEPTTPGIPLDRLFDYSSEEMGRDASTVSSKRKGDEVEPTTPVKRRFDLGLLSRQQKTQRLLLKLMMFAEQYSWERLFHAAIDAFRAGEKAFNIDYPILAHIKDFYQNTLPGSAIRVFFADYAFDAGKSNHRFVWYRKQGWFDEFPPLLDDILERLDGNGPFKYPCWGPDNLVIKKESPMDLHVPYHIHDGKLALFCEHTKVPLNF